MGLIEVSYHKIECDGNDGNGCLLSRTSSESTDLPDLQQMMLDGGWARTADGRWVCSECKKWEKP
jgi:hypothetical protein